MNGLDDIADSINRASGIHCRADHPYALYFSNGRIASVAENSPHFNYRIGKTCKHVVGVYKIDVDFRLIVEDIKFFYDEAIKNQEVPSFIKSRELKNAKSKLKAAAMDSVGELLDLGDLQRLESSYPNLPDPVLVPEARGAIMICPLCGEKHSLSNCTLWKVRKLKLLRY